MSRFSTLFIAFTLFTIVQVPAQEDSERTHGEVVSSEYNVRIIKVRDSIFMLQGKGGNIGVSIGKDGTLLIDDQFPESVPNILNAVSNLTKNPVQFLINTHHHPDHVGGNKGMREAGVSIFAHENTKNRILQAFAKEQAIVADSLVNLRVDKMTGDGMERGSAETRAKQIVAANMPEIDQAKLPMITFTSDLTFNYNGEDILIFHIDNAHTDGDVLVYFTQSNVLHTGDTYIKNFYPFIDAENGGSYAGYINGLKKIMSVIDDETKIIPGHGDIASITDVRYTLSMMEYVTGKVTYHRVDKKTEDQVAGMKDITKEYDEKGFGKGFISTDAFVRGAYKEAAQRYQWIDKSKK